MATSRRHSAIRVALDHPNVKGLILFCSAMPVTKTGGFRSIRRPRAVAVRLCHVFNKPSDALFNGHARLDRGMIQPVSERKTGVILDGKLTNPDMERNFEQYPIEELNVPVLILHSEDDLSQVSRKAK